MKMFLDNGYINMNDLLTNQYVFLFCVGGRGTGKTYGTLSSLLDLQNAGRIRRFLFLRRTQTECDKVSTNATNPFKKINADKGIDVKIKSIKDGLYGFILDDQCIGYSAALSTFANLRGIDFSDVDVIFFDEFIPERSSYKIKKEGEAYFNLYESINRNRELYGEKPVKFISCSNSNFLGNPIFLELQIIPQLEKILLNGGGTFYDKDRLLQVIILKDSPISEKKQNTALYRLTRNTGFSAMAVNNSFSDADNDLIRPSDLNNYTLLTTITGIAIYKHKSQREFYCCPYDKTPKFTSSERDLENFRQKYFYLINRYIDGELYFQDLLTKYTFLLYNKLR